jgi:hypothetical protein
LKLPHLTELRQAGRSHPLPVALAALLLVMLLVQAVLPDTEPLPPVSIEPPRALALQPVPPIAPPEAMLPAVRGLFAPSRSGATGGAGSGDVVLIGLARSRQGAAAVFRTGAGAVTAATGERAGDWRIVEISRDGAVVTGEKGTMRLRIGQGTGGAETAAKPQEVEQ